jgi:hypothetical protein
LSSCSLSSTFCGSVVRFMTMAFPFASSSQSCFFTLRASFFVLSNLAASFILFLFSQFSPFSHKCDIKHVNHNLYSLHYIQHSFAINITKEKTYTCCSNPFFSFLAGVLLTRFPSSVYFGDLYIHLLQMVSSLRFFDQNFAYILIFEPSYSSWI